VKYPILAALSCDDSIHAYFTDGHASHYDYLKKDITTKASDEFKNRYFLLERFLGRTPENRYVLRQKKLGYFPDYPDASGRNFDISRTARIKYVAEKSGSDIGSWFTPFNLGKAMSYSLHANWDLLENELWRVLVDKDEKIRTIYEKASASLNSDRNFPGKLFYQNLEKQKKICSLLKEKSLL